MITDLLSLLPEAVVIGSLTVLDLVWRRDTLERQQPAPQHLAHVESRPLLTLSWSAPAAPPSTLRQLERASKCEEKVKHYPLLPGFTFPALRTKAETEHRNTLLGVIKDAAKCASFEPQFEPQFSY